MSPPPDPFENDLHSLQRSALPADWRQEILAAATTARRTSRTPRWLIASWSIAWAAILLMHFTTPAEPQPVSSARSLLETPTLSWDQRAAIIKDLLAAN